MAKKRESFGGCQALSDKGRQCRRPAYWRGHYFGVHEFYGYGNEPWPGWVRVILCDKHSKPKAKTK